MHFAVVKVVGYIRFKYGTFVHNARNGRCDIQIDGISRRNIVALLPDDLVVLRKSLFDVVIFRIDGDYPSLRFISVFCTAASFARYGITHIEESASLFFFRRAVQKHADPTLFIEMIGGQKALSRKEHRL